jgi:hypothetical protein
MSRQTFLAMITPLDTGAHPDQGLPGGGNYPSQGLPGLPGHPSQGLPWPGRPVDPG